MLYLSTQGNVPDPRTLTTTLGGRWFGSYGRARCPACGGKTDNPPLSIRRSGTGLLVYCFRGCDYHDIRAALGAFGLTDHKPLTAEEAERRRKADEAAAANKARQALTCWNEAQPISGTRAEAYLRGRGITGDLPETLRFHPNCWHSGTARKLPAMVARIDGGKRFGIHRTYLSDDGHKADVEPNKMMLGGAKGGAVRLHSSPGPLVIGEGIESVLSVLSVLSQDGTTWAALSTSGLMGVTLPETPHELIVAVDGDQPGRTAGQSLARRAAAAGWKVSTADPGDGKDFNDLLEVATW
mgnify:CR=1 FL=1